MMIRGKVIQKVRLGHRTKNHQNVPLKALDAIQTAP